MKTILYLNTIFREMTTLQCNKTSKYQQIFDSCNPVKYYMSMYKKKYMSM